MYISIFFSVTLRKILIVFLLQPSPNNAIVISECICWSENDIRGDNINLGVCLILGQTGHANVANGRNPLLAPFTNIVKL